jgi:hypothetical protein
LFVLFIYLEFTEGKTCGCAQWCNERGSRYGVCGNGHTCICTSQLTEKGSIGKRNFDLIGSINDLSFIGDSCRCDGWCRRRNYNNGGICGDGFTCICSP